MRPHQGMSKNQRQSHELADLIREVRTEIRDHRQEYRGDTDSIFRKLSISSMKENYIMRSLDETVAAITEESTVEAGLLVWVKELQAQAKESRLSPEDQAKIDGIFDNAKASAKAMADAMVAGTPADPGGSTGGVGGSTGGV